MGTRSAVGIITGDSWQARYIHWDGYPTHIIPTLREMVARDGLDKVQATITERHAWSSLSTADKADQDCTASPYIEGYGLAYDDAVEPDCWVKPEDGADNMGAEWAYVLAPHDIVVYQVVYDGDDEKFQQVGRVTYDGPAEDIQAIECGTNWDRCSHYAWAHFPEAKDSRLGTVEWLEQQHAAA